MISQSLDGPNKNSTINSVQMKTASLAAANGTMSGHGSVNQTAGFNNAGTGRKNSFNLTFRPKDLEAPNQGAIYIDDTNNQAVQAPRHSEETQQNQ